MSLVSTPEEGEHLRKFLGHIDGQIFHFQKDLALQSKTITFFQTMAEPHHLDISTFPQYRWAQIKRDIDKQLLETLGLYKRYPLYCLLHTSSNLEMEDYRQDMLTSLTYSINEVTQQLEQDTALKEDLERQLAELFEGMEKLSNSYTFNQIDEYIDDMNKLSNSYTFNKTGGELLEGLAKYYLRDCQNPLVKNADEKEKLERRYEEVQAMTREDILDKMRHDYLGNEQFRTFDKISPISMAEAFLATIAADEKRLFACLPLMAQYATLRADTKTFELPCQVNIPSLLKRAFEEGGVYDDDKEHTTNPHLALNIAQDALDKLKELRDTFLQELSDEKLAPLVKHYKNPYISPSLGNYDDMKAFVNLPFLYDNIDKIASDSKSRLHIEDILSHYRKLCKKWFKNASDMEKIQDLHEELVGERNRLYDQIIDWYWTFSPDHGLERISVDFDESGSVNTETNQIAFDTTFDDISEYIHDLRNLCAEYDRYVNAKASKMNKIAGELFQYVGMAASLSEVDFSVDEAENIKKLTDAYVHFYACKTLEYIELEAQNISNMNKRKLQVSMESETSTSTLAPDKQKTLGTMKPKFEQ